MTLFTCRFDSLPTRRPRDQLLFHPQRRSRHDHIQRQQQRRQLPPREFYICPSHSFPLLGRLCLRPVWNPTGRDTNFCLFFLLPVGRENRVATRFFELDIRLCVSTGRAGRPSVCRRQFCVLIVYRIRKIWTWTSGIFAAGLYWIIYSEKRIDGCLLVCLYEMLGRRISWKDRRNLFINEPRTSLGLLRIWRQHSQSLWYNGTGHHQLRFGAVEEECWRRSKGPFVMNPPSWCAFWLRTTTSTCLILRICIHKCRV